MLLCGFGVISIQCIMPCVLCGLLSVAEIVQIKQTDFSISLLNTLSKKRVLIIIILAAQGVIMMDL